MHTQRVFALGDIHGCNRTLQKMLEELSLQAGDELICLGDYIDRGPDSKGVIDSLMELVTAGIKVQTLRGNHEALLLASEDGPSQKNIWLRNGGDTALKSFGVKSIREMDRIYLDFFRDTIPFVIREKELLVHAGLNFHIPDPLSDMEYMLWTRDRYTDPSKIGGRRLIHGHTPTPLADIRASTGSMRINLDGGCVYKGMAGLGNLVAMDLDTDELVVVANCE